MAAKKKGKSPARIAHEQWLAKEHGITKRKTLKGAVALPWQPPSGGKATLTPTSRYPACLALPVPPEPKVEGKSMMLTGDMPA